MLAERTLEARFRGSRNQRIINVPQSLREGKAVLERSEITEERVMLLATNASAIRAEQGQEV